MNTTSARCLAVLKILVRAAQHFTFTWPGSAQDLGQLKVTCCAAQTKVFSTAKHLAVVVFKASLTASNADMYQLVETVAALLARVSSTAKHQAVTAVPASLTVRNPGLCELSLPSLPAQNMISLSTRFRHRLQLA